ncbi:MAG: hypothetical protein WDN08_03030 [Rhizomicrobium sp.]
MSGQIDNNQDGYTDKLVKLLPAEGIAALTTINGLIPLDRDDRLWIVLAIVVVGLFVVLWARQIRKISSVLQLGFILAAYVLWAANIFWPWLTISLASLSDAPNSIPAIFSILFTLFVPFAFPAPAQKPA